MSTYKNLIGKNVKFLSSDPTTDNAAGQIWYNSTSGVFKNVVGASTWSSTGSLNTARRESGAAGTQTASVVFGGGLAPSGNPDTTATEEYNGFNFTASGNMNQAREGMGAAGTQTAALAFGGANYTSGGVLANSEEYGGSSWTAGNALNNSRSYVAGFGLQTAAIATGGGPGTAVTESYDGTNWTNLSSPSNAPGNLFLQASCGTQTAGLTFGGKFLNDTPAPGFQAITVEWNGSSWTAAPNLNQARGRLGGAGTQTAALGFGGYSGPPQFFNVTELYDGNSWTTSSGTLATATGHMHGSGTADAALSAGGATSTAGAVATSYEFNNTVNAITQAAWASGGNLGTARYKISSANAAPQDAGLGFGGRESGSPPTGPGNVSAKTEEYNGTSWSEQNDMNTETRGAVGAGTQTAGLRAGGFDGGPAEQDNTEEYNGTSWTAANDMPANMRLGAGCGTQTAGLAFGGLSSPLSNKAVEYDGTNWTVGGTMNTGRYYMAGFGIQTAAVAAGGNSKDDTEEYDGTSWTSVNDVTSGNTQGAAAGGILTAGLFFGGTRTSVPANTNITLNYDGTNWSTTAAMSTARVALGGTSGGSNTAGLAFGGSAPPSTNATEEFTGETSELNVKTITTS